MNPIRKRNQQIADVLPGLEVPRGVSVRAFAPDDFRTVQALTAAEGWTTPTERPEQTLTAWIGSWPSLVAEDDGGNVIGFLRALTDGEITTYIGEIIVAQGHRGSGIGRLLMEVR